MTAATFCRQLACEQWTKHETTVRTVVYQFIGRHGGEFEETLGNAQVGFMKAFQKMADGRITKDMDEQAHIRITIWHYLIDLHRTATQHRRKEKTTTTTDIDLNFFTAPREFDKMEFLDGLTDDAAYIVQIILDPPPEIAEEATEKGGTPVKLRAAARSYLRRAGWQTSRMAEAFRQVQQALV